MTYEKLVVLVDGQESDAVPATDSSVLRGDGCFEAVRSYGGRLFRLEDHLARLARSADALEMSFSNQGEVATWMRRAAEAGGDCVVRVVLTRGPAVPGVVGSGRCIVLAHPSPPRASGVSLWPVLAPWHPAGRSWDLAGAKTISYAPNLAATRTARRHGADDALLISDADLALEGPTFSVAWCRGRELFMPPLELGILDSITRRVVIELWPGAQEAETTVEALQQADEVLVMSTLREVTPVTALAGTRLPEGPITAELVQRFAQLVGQEGTSTQPE